jgi:hypothetical protein
MATSTTQAVWRSLGGDQTKTAYAGSMLMAADFYFSATAAANTAVQRSSTDSRSVILPAGAVVLEVYALGAGTGGSSPTFDMGFTTYTSGTTNADALVQEGDAGNPDLKQVINWASGTAGTSLGAVMSATEMVKITGSVGASAATGGNISGRVVYYVPTNGAIAT